MQQNGQDDYTRVTTEALGAHVGDIRIALEQAGALPDVEKRKEIQRNKYNLPDRNVKEFEADLRDLRDRLTSAFVAGVSGQVLNLVDLTNQSV